MRKSRILFFAACFFLASCGVGVAPTAPPGPPITAKYKLTVVISPSNGGSVTVSPNQTEYAAGTFVTLVATANPGYSFVYWTDFWSRDSTSYFFMNGNRTVTALFQANE